LTAAREEYVEAVKGAHDDVLQAFDKDKFDLVRRHAEKDAAGNVVSENGMFKFPPGFDAEAALADIKAKHPGFDEAIAERDARLKHAADLDIEVTIFQIAWKYLPDPIKPAVLDAIMPLIAEPPGSSNPDPAAAAAA
jgi:hypothetical protein